MVSTKLLLLALGTLVSTFVLAQTEELDQSATNSLAPGETPSEVASSVMPIQTPTPDDEGDTGGDGLPGDELNDDDVSVVEDEDGYTITSTIPLGCIEGCLQISEILSDCRDDPTSPDCAGTCNETSYGNMAACNECLVANGAADAQERSDRLFILMNDLCAAQDATISTVTEVTVTATTTGPFLSSWTGPSATLPVWTGLTQYVTNAAQISVSSSGSSSTSVSGSTTAQSTSEAPSSSASAAPSETPSGAALRGVTIDRHVGMTGLFALAGWLLA